MPLKEEILLFKEWACSLGAPIDAVPSDEALKSIFKSRQSELLFSLTKKVRSSRNAIEVRQNILLSKTEQEPIDAMTTSMRNFLPKEIQTYLKIEDLKNRKAAVETKLKEVKIESDVLAAVTRGKNIQKVQCKQKLEMIDMKANILEIKSDSLDDYITKEEMNKKCIISLMPVTVKQSNASESLAINAINESSDVLEEFYGIFNNNNNGINIYEPKSNLWMNLRKIFSDISPYILWCAILKISEKQLQEIIALTKLNSTENVMEIYNNFSPFEIEMLKLRTLFLTIMSKCVAEKQKILQLSQAFLHLHQTFENAFRSKIVLYNTGNVENYDDIMADYICKYNMISFTKAQMEFIEKEIKLYKTRVVEGNQKIDGHQILLSSTREIYDDIDTYVTRILQETRQLGQVKEKIIYSKNVLRSMLNASNRSLNAETAKIGNSSHSFEISEILCSTKVDFENSLTNLTLKFESNVCGNKTHQVAAHANELTVFKEFCMEKVHFLSKECFSYLYSNPLITNEQESSPLLQLIPDILLISKASLHIVQEKVKWNENIRKYSIDMTMVLPQASGKLLNAKNAAQKDEITEKLDEIECIQIHTEQQLKDLKKYYKFILENPLRHLIPSTKRFNNRTYREYESEYTTLYRMVPYK